MNTRSLPPPATLNNSEQSKVVASFLLCAVLLVMFPGALAGAGVAFGLWRITRTDVIARWLIAGLSTAAAAAQPTDILVAWPWRLLGESLGAGQQPDIQLNSILASLPAEALVGPLVLVVFQLGAEYRQRTIHGQEWARYTEVARRKKALEHGWPGPQGAGAPQPTSQEHPDHAIRLGVLAKDGSIFDLAPAEIAQHIFVPGASGTGKTTTLVRLADGALSSGYPVVIIDCKGVGLGGEARKLAERHGLPFTRVDPQDPLSVGYDPCSGDAATVANKLIGAFSFSGEAEIYKQVAMEVIPVICRALASSRSDVTLDSIYDALGKGGLSELGRRKGAEKYRDKLESLEEAGGVGTAGYVGLQKRLGALMEGTFGELFRTRPAIDWHKQMGRPQVTYLSLSTTAAGEDVELFGRVITQDLKQVCGQRMRAIDQGKNPIPVLIIYDEFAALREARQIVELLLQARQARAPLVVATQYLPEEIPIRKPVLSAGILIAHRLEAEDANAVAAEFGTHTTPNLTAQVDYTTGESAKGSVRYVEEFDMHPNELKSLPVGTAAVYVRKSNRKELVRVLRTT